MENNDIPWELKEEEQQERMAHGDENGGTFSSMSTQNRPLEEYLIGYVLLVDQVLVSQLTWFGSTSLEW